MNDDVAALQRSIDRITDMVDHLDSPDLAKPTLCTEWTVRDLINHLTGGATMFAVSAEGGSLTPDELAALGGDTLGDDVAGAWKNSSRRAMSAFSQPGVLEKTVTLPFGEMPAGVALNLAVFDVTTHACDLARALGQSFGDDELLGTALAIGPQMVAPPMREAGLFGPEQPTAPDASNEDRLLAFAGRKV